VYQDQTLELRVGDRIPDHRLSPTAFAGTIHLLEKPVLAYVSADAVQAATDSRLPIVAELELYFSCLVRKQVRFHQTTGLEPGTEGATRLVPGLYAAFRAVTTARCAIAEAGDRPPVEVMPVDRPGRFVPDWMRIDYHRGRWQGEYGFASGNRGPFPPQSNRRHP